ncbi:SDR family NAD(P)-dependent oxidoreductase, partial [Pseudomonas gingeri]
MQLHEARVVLTGASGGIGLAIANALCAAGTRVLAVARHQEALLPLLERYPQNLCWVAADLTFLSDRRKVLTAAENIGGINLLINAAGINHFAMLEQLEDSDINAMLAVNI